MEKKILWSLTVSTEILLIRGRGGDFCLCLWYTSTYFETQLYFEVSEKKSWWFLRKLFSSPQTTGSTQKVQFILLAKERSRINFVNLSIFWRKSYQNQEVQNKSK